MSDIPYIEELRVKECLSSSDACHGDWKIKTEAGRVNFLKIISFTPIKNATQWVAFL